MTTEAAVEYIEKLSPRRGDIVVVHLSDPATDDEIMAAMGKALGAVARQTGATILILTNGTTLEQIDEMEMLARGWRKVGPIAHRADPGEVGDPG